MKVNILKTKSCETLYLVQHEESTFHIQICAIFNDALCLELIEKPYRIQSCEISPFSTQDFHQNVKGPVISDLDGKSKTFMIFAKKAYAQVVLYREREKQVNLLLKESKFVLEGENPGIIYSRRYHDKRNNFYFRLFYNLISCQTYRVTEILFDYSPCKKEIDSENLLDRCWVEANDIIRNLKKDYLRSILISDLTEIQFVQYLKAIKLLVNAPKNAREAKNRK